MKKKKIFNNIFFLGLVSFFADISGEMVYPLIPLYLTTTFGATPVLVGIIEGIAESVASLLRVFSGYISDKYNKRKPIAFIGYTTGLLYKIILIISTSWVGILIARIVDKLGKGIRTAPRDVLISETADEKTMGKSFGIHKMLDMTGSAIGIFLAFILLKNIGQENFKTIFVISIIPVLFALIMFIFVKDSKIKVQKEKIPFKENIKKLDDNLKLYLLIAFIFTLGNSSNTFLLLRATDLGFTSVTAILLYFIYNISSAIFAIPFGKMSDKVGRKKILVIGYALFSLVYFIFGFATNKWMLVIAFIIYGLYTAMVTGVERAFIAEISPTQIKGTMLGLHSTLVGIALFPASLIAGLLWNNIGPYAPFVLGATLAIIASILLLFFFKQKEEA